MNENKTTYFHKMMGGAMTPHSILILGNHTLVQSIVTHAYINFLFDYMQGMKIELWEDRSWLDIKNRKLLRNYHGGYMKHYRPTKLFDKEKQFDQGLRKLYDEFVLRRSNRHSQSKKIIFLDKLLLLSDKPKAAMVAEILKDGGKKCNIQFIANTFKGSGEFDEGLYIKFDIRIATLPLSKKDSIALFGSDKYASNKEGDFVYFAYKNNVEKVPIFRYDTLPSNSDVYLNLIRTWSF